jgi:replication-associated recombination protein RarA
MTTLTSLVGPAERVRTVLWLKIQRLISGDWSQKEAFLLWGPPGTAKTTIAGELALEWAGSPFTIETLNGQELSVDRIRSWQGMMPGRPLYGNFFIKFIDEIDQGSPAAFGMLRTFLNPQHMPKFIGIIATTNKSPESLWGIQRGDTKEEVQRKRSFQSRFYDREVPPPSLAEIRLHLEGMGAPADVAAGIANCSGGDMRQALTDLRKWKDQHQTEAQVQSVGLQGTQVHGATLIPAFG